MRYRARLLLAFVLIVSSLINAARSMGAAQEGETDGAGISYAYLVGEDTVGGAGQVLRAYQFTFAVAAYIPEQQYAEAMVVEMVVEVEAGSFAFRVGDEDLVLVDPAGQAISILVSSGEPSPDPTQAPHYNPSGSVITVDGGPDSPACVTRCAIPPHTIVQLDPGFLVILPKETTCFWCNLLAEAAGEARLKVYAVMSQDSKPEDFSWVAQLPGVTPSAATGVRAQSVVLPNIALYCRGGT